MKRRMKKFIAVNNYSLFYIIWPINVTFEAESKKKKENEVLLAKVHCFSGQNSSLITTKLSVHLLFLADDCSLLLIWSEKCEQNSRQKTS